MRLTDLMFRQGHLSESGLIEAVSSHERPAHLDQCDLCAQRAAELTDWLSDIKATGLETADRMFPDEKLKVQRRQLLARLAQEDEPSRVIAFPGPVKAPMAHTGGMRVSAGWLGIAAAAGIVLGLIGGQITARMSLEGPPPAAIASSAADQAPATLLDSPTSEEFNRYTPEALSAIDEMMPTILLTSTQGG